MESTFRRTHLITAIASSTHGDLAAYADVTRQAAKNDPEFLAHFIAWNEKHGKQRDPKLALPVVSLERGVLPGALEENSWAHLLAQSPRDLLRAYRFAGTLDGSKRSKFRSMIVSYLNAREDNWHWWERTALQHRSSVKGLYALCHVKSPKAIKDILFEGQYPANTVFASVKNLPNMTPTEAAGTIIEQKIPFLIARGALGKKMSDPTVLMALIGAMSPTELVTNMKSLEKLGVKNFPETRAALEAAIGKVATSKKQVMKTSVAAKAVSDTDIAAKLQAAQERQLKNVGIDGDWLVFGDNSGSMERAIEATKFVAGTMAGAVKGNIHLVFGNVQPRYFNATGKTLADIEGETKLVEAGGGTALGCGLDYLLQKGILVQGIVLVTDGEENSTPAFAGTYRKYVEKLGIEPTVYLVLVDNGGGYLSGTYYAYRYNDCSAFLKSLAENSIYAEAMDCRGGKIDYHSFPNLLATMRTGRYGLADEIMEAPLLTLAEVLKPRRVA